MTKNIASLLLLVFVLASAAQAEEMPAPRRMPRVPVSREVLAQPHDAMPSSREIQGLAAIIDGEKLRIADTDLRLFGVVPPQLAASFGPQARTDLDTLANGQNVSCQIRDRDRDGRLLATCRNSNGVDMALDLLKHGLAVTARGSIAGTELAAAYAAAEQAAQNQKIGLWSVSMNAIAAAAPSPQIVKQDNAIPREDSDSKKDEKTTARADKTSIAESQTQAKIAADLLSQQAQIQAQARIDDSLSTAGEDVGFFERYQILIAGFLMLTTALCIIGALLEQKSRDKRDDIKALAAALRGELMAARSICVGRSKSITSDIEDRLAIWPRIRATLYQAYVGHLGFLGAELARQVASIYGQSSDYAALYQASASATHEVPKKKALEMLAKHIDEVLPKLAEIERTGRIPVGGFGRLSRVQNDVATKSVDANAYAAETHAVVVSSTQAILRAAISALEGARSFIQNYRSAAPPPPQPLPIDPQIAEYAAMIEADMARYECDENAEQQEAAPIRRRG